VLLLLLLLLLPLLPGKVPDDELPALACDVLLVDAEELVLLLDPN
jgi:hypothetical protein